MPSSFLSGTTRWRRRDRQAAGLREVKRCLHGAPYAWPHLVQPTPRTGRLLILLPKLLTTLCVTRRVRFSRTEQSETHMKKVARSWQAPAKLILSKALLVSFSLGLGHASLHAEPRLTVISQWSAGAEGAAMDAFGNLVKKEGVTWQHSPVSGFTTDMMNKLRADIIAGRPPAASQLKGPQIKAWSAIGATVNMNDVVAATDFAQNISPDLAKLHQPKGNWIALPLQISRVNTLYASKKSMDKIGATELPKTWDEFNAMAKKMADAGITPVAHGGIAWSDTMYFELVLAGISPDAYKRAIMELDAKVLRGPEVLAAFKELRQLTQWMNPSNAGQHWSVFLPALMKGEYGFLMMGGWASGVLKRGNFLEGKDFLCGATPNNSGKPVFDMNADGLVFWDTKNPDLLAGQKATAKVVMGKEFARTFTQLNGSVPVRTDVDLSDAGYQDCQRDAAKNLKGAIAANQVLMSLGHNMAQTSSVTGALRDVLTEFVHNKGITAEEAQKRLANAADAVR
ncbi:ABC transporter substrate-binding protein [Verminephrobacter eiseniae]|uniref:ABC transporter substrate-binding protein n=1 Tax=Verminephrobacter eiseniae TaxID=364317 RepID=UPI0022382F85|nr:ABC transporter substrate-binding protein [Verminephrobacter eiseniae]MCW5232258.1 carbohydrate ABC transporter substrate-binding protein [Verminephrobacter eiseniae]MCW5296179.1 carbohydrate ABC transporter substrate-binding protein [Verminephrobacter eiseniae]MCW8185422.1 carbohydrate ABC transporter substrate-binding protein [Verminephrobacter eiseniae]MCW8224103.1 carbohydrate ABC transporter substrate-binding protein [Verminephrobacter eiseniae]MCW8235219.1 carbohydrate ABC transporter